MKKESNDPCLWMASGAVKKKNCNNSYDCLSCKYDKGMMKKVERNKQISWQDMMRKQDGINRLCRYSLTQRIQNKICHLNYNCFKCEYDQLVEDVLIPSTA